MRSWNRKKKPKHMTKMKYKIDKFNWIFMYQKSSKNISIKHKYSFYEEYAKTIPCIKESEVIENYKNMKHEKYKRYVGMICSLEKQLL